MRRLRVLLVAGALLALILTTAAAAAPPNAGGGGSGNAGGGSGGGGGNPGGNAGDGGANGGGPFDGNENQGAPSNNGNNQGNGVPCQGCVGNADDKNPPGQGNNDANRGYECDANRGVGRGNPAHSGCSSAGGGSSADNGNGSRNGNSNHSSDEGAVAPGQALGAVLPNPPVSGGNPTEASDPRKGRAIRPAVDRDGRPAVDRDGGPPQLEQAAHRGGDEELPFSGLAVIPLLVVGLGLLASGLVLRRRAAVDRDGASLTHRAPQQAEQGGGEQELPFSGLTLISLLVVGLGLLVSGLLRRRA